VRPQCRGRKVIPKAGKCALGHAIRISPPRTHRRLKHPAHSFNSYLHHALKLDRRHDNQLARQDIPSPEGYVGAVNADEKMSKQPRFLTMEQAAGELSVGVPTVRQLLKTGELRGAQIGARGLWRGIGDLDAYID
jgi:excisionase family DNA binding protein